MCRALSSHYRGKQMGPLHQTKAGKCYMQVVRICLYYPISIKSVHVALCWCIYQIIWKRKHPTDHCVCNLGWSGSNGSMRLR